MDEFIRFLCPSCQKKLKHRDAGTRVKCRFCGNVTIVPESAVPTVVQEDEAELSGGSSPVIWLLLIPGGLLAVTSLFALLAFALFNWVVGAVLLAVALFFAGTLLKLVFDLATAKARAIERGEREVKLFFGFVKLVLWEQNEGVLFLRNKKISEVVYGPQRGGGMKYIFPILGDEWKVHVPLTLQLSVFEDDRILTREAIQLYVKIAFWWRIKDKDGLEKFYLLLAREVRQATDRGYERVRDYRPARTPGPRRDPRRSELDAAERWMRTIIESCLRKLVSRQSVAFIISREASAYLQVDRHPDQSTALAQIDAPAATPDRLAASVQVDLARDAATYGIEIERVEVQEVRLPSDIQREIDKVWKSALAPAQSKPEAEAIAMRIRAQLEAVAQTVGKDAAAAGHVMGQMGNMQIVGGLPEAFQKLISRLANGAGDLAKLTDNSAPAAAKSLEPPPIPRH